jgi:small subunit ribosomal protein S15
MKSTLITLFCSVALVGQLSVSAFLLPSSFSSSKATYRLSTSSPNTEVLDNDITFEGNFEDDAVKPSLSSLLEEDESEGNGDQQSGDNEIFNFGGFVPDMPDVSAIGASRIEQEEVMEFATEDIDLNDEAALVKELGYGELQKEVEETLEEEWEIPAPAVHYQRIQEVTARFQKHEKDTGSSAVQIARLTERIVYLTNHLQAHPKDVSTRRGLIRLVNMRRKLLNYLHGREPETVATLVSELGIRYKAPSKVQNKFDKYRFFKNTKHKNAKFIEA